MPKSFYEQKCRICGCDWNHACNDHDYWFAEDLCSACAEKMKPILFNTPMVQAILDGRKTSTRRVIKPKCRRNFIGTDFQKCPMECRMIDDETQEIIRQPNPPYQPGDILYVREAFNSDWCDHTIYKADGGSAKVAGYLAEPKWHPSIHMPKEAARIFLRVTDVKAERLHTINADGAIAEGAWGNGTPHLPFSLLYQEHPNASCNAVASFAHIWDRTINRSDRDKYGWNANPWVWAL